VPIFGTSRYPWYGANSEASTASSGTATTWITNSRTCSGKRKRRFDDLSVQQDDADHPEANSARRGCVRTGFFQPSVQARCPGSRCRGPCRSGGRETALLQKSMMIGVGAIEHGDDAAGEFFEDEQDEMRSAMTTARGHWVPGAEVDSHIGGS
jgi:hypothetical protein